MVLTAKERMLMYRRRIREDPEKHEQYKQSEHKRYLAKKERGVVKSVDDMSVREARRTRRHWRVNAKTHRDRKRTVTNAVRIIITPPNSPPDQQVNVPCVHEDENARSRSMKKTMTRKRRREDEKVNRKITKLTVKLQCQERLVEKYKKRFNRAKDRSNFSKKIEKSNGKFMVKSYLLYHTMIANIRKRYNKRKSYKHRRMIGNLICSHTVLRKYGLGAFARGVLGISRRHLMGRQPRPTSVKKLRMKVDVQQFYERDDNSTIKADKQATITRKGVKKQIRLLSDDMKNLHAKYLSENMIISYSLFCRLRPFWTVKPSGKERPTCLCKIHDNLRFKLNMGFSAHMYESRDVNVLAKKLVCDDKKKECMYRECTVCADKKLEYNNEDEGEQLKWNIWKNKRVEKIVKGKPKVVTITCKEEEQGTRATLSEEITGELNRACRHIFNIKHQYNALTYLRQHLSNEDIVIHIDFSENYVCKYAEEIQSVHFGASKRQISLHTGVAYVTDEVIPFCTTSDAFYHGPAAIWAHLHPVLKSITSGKQYKSVHFVSDGPTTQYRNKQNFYLWGHKISEYGFDRSTWNFMEAGHGKGAADGIGAAVKRNADAEVIIRKKDITCAKDFVQLHESTSSRVRMFLVEEDEITNIERQVPAKLKVVQNTMKIHQLVLENPGSFRFAARVVSCFCGYPRKLLCDCYSPVTAELEKKLNAITPAMAISEDTLTPATTTSTEGGEPTPAITTTAVRGEDGPVTTNVGLQKVFNIDEGLVGRYCVVEYENLPYPGIIQDVDDNEVEVKVMHRIGVNKFFWPSPIEDRLWYRLEQIVTLLDCEPAHITNRNCQIPPRIWEAIVGELHLDEFGR